MIISQTKHSRKNCSCIRRWFESQQMTLLYFIESSKTEIARVYKLLQNDLRRTKPIVCKNNNEYFFIIDFVKHEIDNRFYNL